MSHSLLIAGIEVINRSVNDLVRLASDIDFGEGTPDQATIGSLYLDGEAIVGERRSNRAMQFPLNFYGTNALDVGARIDAMLAAVNVPTFQVQWTPDGGLPIIFDAFRAKPTRARNLNLDAAGGPSSLLLEFPALPFGRSPLAMSIAAAATSTQLDSFDAARTGATIDASIKFEGSGSNKVTLTSVSSHGGKEWVSGATPLSHAFGSAQDLSADNAISFRWRWPAPGSAAALTGELTLTDSAARTVTIFRSKDFVNGDTNWRLVNFPLSGLGSFDLTHVVSWSLVFFSTVIYGGGSSSSVWVDDMRAQPSSSVQTSSTHGAQLFLPSTVGSARAPANLALSTGGTLSQFLLHSPPADQDPDAGILVALDSTLNVQDVTIPIANAKLRGTFSIVLGGATDGSAGTIQVTVTQKENGTQVGSPWVSPQIVHDITTQGLLFAVGEVTLPLYDTPADNTGTSYLINVNISAGTDRYSEVMLCDTAGQTVLTDTAAASTGSVVYVDEPGPLQSGPPVYISSSDRSAAWGKTGDCVPSGGPVLLEPGSNKFLVWTDSGTPAMTATYFPRWLDERVA